MEAFTGRIMQTLIAQMCVHKGLCVELHGHAATKHASYMTMYSRRCLRHHVLHCSS